jgi:hypothetical protein
MANESTSSTLAGLMKTLVADTQAEFLTLPNLMNAVYAVESDSLNVQFPVIGTEMRVAAAAAEGAGNGEGADLANTAINIDAVTATLVGYGVKAQVSALALKGGSATSQSVGKVLAGQISNAVNDAIGDVIAAINHDTIVISGALTMAHISDGVGIIRDAGYHGQINACLHPKQYYDADYGLVQSLIGAAATPSSAVGVTDEMLRNGWVNKLMGVDIYLSNKITESGSYAKGGIFAQEAIGLGYHNPIVNVRAAENPNGLGVNIIGEGYFKAVELDDAGGSVLLQSLIS